MSIRITAYKHPAHNNAHAQIASPPLTALSSLLSIILLALVPFPSGKLSAQTLTINTTGQPPLNTADQTGFMDEIAKEAFRRIAVDIATLQLPAERGLKNANAGIEDGEMSRIGGLQNVYPNLIQVPEKIMDWEFVGFSKQPIRLEKGWDSLPPHAVAFINGWKILENNIPSQTPTTRVRTPEQLFTLLEKDRTDVIIYERWGGLHYIRSLGLRQIRLNEPPLAVREMFIYLHKKHRALVPRLAEALREMKRDGSYQAIYERRLSPWEVRE